MLVNKRKSNLEYSSILFFGLSLFYFSYACSKKALFHSSYTTIYEESLKNFDIYKAVLAKYDANLLDIKIVDGYVEALIEKNGFNKDSFLKNEPYLIEELNDHKYLITFKFGDNANYKRMESIKDENNKEISIESFCYIDSKNWYLIINGVIYSESNIIINENSKIKSVDNNKIIISINQKDKIFIV